MSRPLILLTNDDGVDAPGLRALETVMPADWEVHVVAPAAAMSQCSHRITTHEPLPVVSRGPRRHAVSGTPADCVRLASTHLLPRKPDWVISGINHGGNLGADIYVSGTVAAVREAAYLGMRGIALSHYQKRPLPIDWDWAAACAKTVIAELMDSELGRGEHWNVNLPHVEQPGLVPPRVSCDPSRHSLPVSFKRLTDAAEEGACHFLYDGIYADRERETGSDIDVCFGGQIAVSKLRL